LIFYFLNRDFLKPSICEKPHNFQMQHKQLYTKQMMTPTIFFICDPSFATFFSKTQQMTPHYTVVQKTSLSFILQGDFALSDKHSELTAKQQINISKRSVAAVHTA